MTPSGFASVSRVAILDHEAMDRRRFLESGNFWEPWRTSSNYLQLERFSNNRATIAADYDLVILGSDDVNNMHLDEMGLPLFTILGVPSSTLKGVVDQVWLQLHSGRGR